ncbi:efflux RND transporter periplasmic adaptor subunit [Shewanella gaetbuli]
MKALNYTLQNSKQLLIAAASLLIINTATAQQGNHVGIDTLIATEVERVQYLTLDAKVEPIKSATVAAQTSGRVLAIHYDVNDLVSAGSPLLEITSEEQGAELAAAEAELARAKAINIEAQAQLKRYKTLFPQGAISQGSMDEATAKAKSSQQAVSAANASLIKAKQTVNYTVISAPYTGRITEKLVEEGETVVIGQGLLSGYATNSLRAVFFVPQQYRQQVANLTKINFYLDEHQPNRQYQSNHITPFAFSHQADHSIEVRAILDNQQDELFAGQWLKTKLAIDKKSIISLPLTTLHQIGDVTSVYRQVGDNYLQTQIRVGKHFIDENGVPSFEVLAGVMPDDIIVKNANHYILHLHKLTAN